MKIKADILSLAEGTIPDADGVAAVAHHRPGVTISGLRAERQAEVLR